MESASRMEYLKFDIRLPVATEGEPQRVIVESAAGYAKSTVTLPLHNATFQDNLEQLQHMLLSFKEVRPTTRSTYAQEESARTVGNMLFTALFHDEVLQLYDESVRKAATLPNVGLLLRFEIAEPTLAALPWELLYDARAGGRYISCYNITPIVRALPPPYQHVPSPVMARPLRMLCMVANPDDHSTLNTRDEEWYLHKALQTLIDNGTIIIERVKGRTWRDLQNKLLEQEWHILHFIGHGGYEERPAGGTGILAFEDKSGNADIITAAQVSQLLDSKPSLRLVVLNACEGARGNTQDIFSSTATTLLSQCHRLAAVLAMQYEITDMAAIEFTRTFYTALAGQVPVESAMTAARVAIGLEVRRTLEWGTPVLYTRSQHSILFTFPPQEQREAGTLLFTCRDHQAPIRTIAWSPDGRFIASGDDSGLALVADSTTGTTIAEYRYHTSAVQAVSWSPDSTRIASVSLDGYVHVWNAATGKQLLQLILHRIPSIDSRAATLAWSRDGRLIAAGGNDELVKVWDSETGQLITTYREHTHRGEIALRLAWILALAWSPDGRYIVSGGGGYKPPLAAPLFKPLFDTSVHIWEARTARRVFTYNDHKQSVTGLAWSPDGRYIASCDRDRQIHVWEPTQNTQNTHPLVFNGHTNSVNAVSWSPNSTDIASASDDTTVRIWHLHTRNERFVYKGHDKQVNAVVWSPDGQRIASGGNDKTIHVWQVTAASTGPDEQSSIPRPPRSDAPVINHSDNTDATGNTGNTGNAGNIPGLISTRDIRHHQNDSHARWVSAVAWSPDGSRIASSGGDGTVRILDPDTGNELLTYKGQAGPRSEVLTVAWSPDSTRIASGGNRGSIHVWNVSRKQKLAEYNGHPRFANKPYITQVFWAVWSPDGSRIASACISLAPDKAVHIWNPVTEKLTLKIGLRNGLFDIASSPGGIAWSPDGTRIAAGLTHETRIYNAVTGTQLFSYKQQSGYISTVAWSPDGSRIASLEEKSVHIWDAKTGEFLYAYRGHSDSLRDVAWSPNGQYLASSSNDHTVHIWTADNGTHIFTYNEHHNDVGGISWSPDSRRIASVSKDRTVHIWQAV